MSTSTMEEFDYEWRLQAYERMDASLFARLNRSTGLLVLSQAVFGMGSLDMSLRHSSSSRLQSFVKFASTLAEEKSLDDLQGVKTDEVNEDADLSLNATDGEVSGEPVVHVKTESGLVKSLVQKFLLPHVRNAMGSEVFVVRRVRLTRAIITDFTGNMNLLFWHL